MTFSGYITAGSPRTRAVLVVCAFTIYALTYLPLRAQVGIAAGLLALVPVVLTGWAFGLRGGFLAGLIVTPLHTLLINLAGIRGWDVVLRETNGLGPLVTIAIGLATGYWSDLIQSLQEQINKRRQAEAILLESSQLLERMFASLRDAVIILDATTMEILDCNSATSEIFGYSREEMLGQTTLFLHIDEAALDKFVTRLNSAVEEGGYLSLTDFQMKRKDGSLFSCEHSVFPLETEHGQRIGWVSVIRDITERMQAEEALRRSEEKYRGLFNSLEEGIAINEMILDEHGDVVDYVILDVNPAFERQSPYKSEKAIGKPATDLYQLSSEFIHDWFRDHPEMKEAAHTELYHEPSARWFNIVTTPPEENRFATIFTDITERKLADKKLRESERRLALALEAAQMGVWEWDLETNTFYSSPSLYGIVGLDSSDTRSEWFRNLIHPEDIDRVLQEMQKALAGKTLFVSEFRLIRPDGRVIWLSDFGQVEYDESRKPLRMVGTIEDITLRKRVEDTSRLQSVALETAANGIVITDREGIIQWVNPAFTTLTGFTLDEALGKNPRALLRSGVQDRAFYKNMWNTILAGQVWRGELVNRRKDGSLYTEEMTLTPLKDERDEVTSFIAIKQDVSERVRADQVVRDSQARLASIIDSAMDAIISLDTEQRITHFNPAAERMFRCSADEVIGQPLDRFLPERYRKIHREHIRVFSQTGQTSRPMGTFAPLTCLRADGEEFLAEITISQAETVGEKIYTAILRDITQRKTAEEALNNRVSELSALYQTTLDIISPHDLPDLLNTIVMRAVDLLNGTGGGMYLCDPGKKQVRCVVSYKTPEDYTGTMLAYGEGAAGVVAATGEPLIIDDYRTWNGRAEAFEGNQPFNAVISVPMLWQGQVTGVIHVLHSLGERKFTGEDLKLLASFANQAAIAVENARLLKETRLRLEQLATLRHIDEAITSSLDLRVTLNILLGHIQRQLKVDATAVLLYQPELQSLEFVAGQGFHTRALQFTNLRLGQGFAGRAILEQRTVVVSDMDQMQIGFLRSPEFHSEQFVAYIGVPLIAKGNITGVLEIYHRQALDPDREWVVFLETLAGQAAIAIDNIRLFESLQSSNLQLRQAYDATIQGWAQALELRDMETKGHSHRAVDLTMELAEKLGVEDKKMTPIRWGALLHDIGKMGVPDSILQKPGPLTNEEWEIMRQHPVHAYKWLSPIMYLKPALDITYCHHEKWNGTGYPRGLKEEQIPLAARIFAVVDVWDALRSDRPYRGAWPQEKALAYLRDQAGKHFDPLVVEAFIDLLAEKGLINQL